MSRPGLLAVRAAIGAAVATVVGWQTQPATSSGASGTHAHGSVSGGPATAMPDLGLTEAEIDSLVDHLLQG